MRRWLRVCCLLLALLTLSGAGAAQQSDLARAKAAFQAGASAYAAGDYSAAIQALELAYELSPLPAIAFSLAQAERRQYLVDRERRHLARAVTLFRRYLEQEPRGARREDALMALALLEPQLREQAPAAEAPPVQTSPTRVMIVANAPGARISLDGGPAAPSPLIREVTPGVHRARVQASGYYDVERDVIAVGGELLLTEVQLTERPSSLYVWAPDGAEIYVDGVYVARGGGRVVVPLASGRHQLTVAQKGRRLVRRDFEIERGKARAEAVTLEATPQRKLSEVLFITGGAALGAGLVLSAFAVRSENSAEPFLTRTQHRSVPRAELIAYNAALLERNRYRTAAAVSVAGAFGMFVTGLFLHELDNPRIPVAPTAQRLRGSADARSRVALAPVVSTTDAGAALQVNF